MFTAWTDKDLKCLHRFFFHSFLCLVLLLASFNLSAVSNDKSHNMLLLLFASFAIQRFVDKATLVC